MQPPGGGVRMQGPPGFNGPPQMHQQQQPRFQGGPPPQWNGPRPNGPGPMPGPNMGMRPVGPPPGPQGPPRPPMVKFYFCSDVRKYKENPFL